MANETEFTGASPEELAAIESQMFETEDDFEGASEDELADIEKDLYTEPEKEYSAKVDIPGVGPFSSLWKFDTGTGDIGVELPDFNLDGLKVDNSDADADGKTSLSESLASTWNNSLNQLSLTDDRFYWLSEYLFGDNESVNFKEAEEAIQETEDNATGTIGFTDVDDIYAEQGLIGALGGVTAATINAGASFLTSAVQSAATGGAGLAVDMIQGGIRDFNVAKAEEQGVSLDELIENGDAETLIPGALGTLAYRFEKFGIKGVGKAISAMPTGARKVLVEILNASGKEGGTEFAQGIVEAFSTGLGKSGNDVGKATSDVANWVKEEGLETFLQGAVGGGVSAGGGRVVSKQLKRAKNVLRSKDAEESVLDISKKIMEIDKVLNDPNAPQEEKDILQGVRKDLKKNFDAAIKEPDAIVNKLSDEQIKDINKHSDKIKEHRKDLKDVDNLSPEVQETVKDNVNLKVGKEIDKINKIVENRSSKNIRDEDGNFRDNTELQKKFEGLKKGEISDASAFEIASAYENKVKSTVSSLFRDHPEFKEQSYTYDDFVSDLKFGGQAGPSNSVIGLAKSYDPSIGSIGGYISSQIRNRGKAILKKEFEGKIDTTSLDNDDGTTNLDKDKEIYDQGIDDIIDTVPVKTKLRAKELEISDDVAQKIVDVVENTITTKAFDTSTAAKFNSAVSKTAKKKLYNVLKEEIGVPTAQADRFFRNLTSKWDKYLDVIPKKSFKNSRGITNAWGETPPTQREFIDYFRGVDIDASDRDSVAKGKAKTKRREQLANWVAEGLFAEAADDLLYSKPSVAKRFEILNKLGENVKDHINTVSAARAQFIKRVIATDKKVKGPKEGSVKISNKGLTERFTDVMDQAWEKAGIVPVQSTTDSSVAVNRLIKEGHFKNKAEALDYLESVYGFTMQLADGTRFIYNDKDRARITTPIHEMGHIWSSFIQDNNPLLFNEGMKVLLADPVKREYQAKRLVELYDGKLKKFGEFVLRKEWTPELIADFVDNRDRMSTYRNIDATGGLDEMLAGEIGDRGEYKAFHAAYDGEGKGMNPWTVMLQKMWDYIGGVLAKVKGKEIKDINADEFLDLAVSDVMSGKPGAAFAEMNIPVGENKFQKVRNEALAELKANAKPEQIKEQGIYDGLTAFKDALEGGMIMAKAIDVGEKASGLPRQDWYEAVGNAVNQLNIDNAGLQQAFDTTDFIGDKVDKLWNKFAGGKVPKLLRGRCDGCSQAEQDIKYKTNFDFFKKYEETFTKFLPKQFFENMTVVKKGEGDTGADSMLRPEDAQYFADLASESDLVWDNPDAFSKIAGRDNIDKIVELAKSEKYLNEVDNNQKVVFALGDAMQNIIESGEVPLTDVARLIKSFTNTGNGKRNYFRKAPKLAGYSDNLNKLEKKGHVPEHNPPAGYIAMTMLEYASKGKWNDDIKNAIADKFEYYALDKADDPGHTEGAGHKNLVSGITNGFNLLTDNPIIRYVASGGNIGNLKDVNGNFIAEKYGIERGLLTEYNKDNSKALAQAIRDIVISRTVPLEQQLTQGLDVYLSEIAELIANADLTPGEVEQAKVSKPKRRKKGAAAIDAVEAVKGSDGVITFPNGKRVPTEGDSLGATTFNSALEALAANPNITGQEFYDKFVKDNVTKKTSTNYYLGFAKKWINQQEKVLPPLQAHMKRTKGLKDAQFKRTLSYAKRIGAYRAGDEDLDIMEMGRLISRIKEAEKERGTNPERSEKLSIFDFDDTLYNTTGSVVVYHEDGSHTRLNSDQYKSFVPAKGDVQDFADFDNVNDPIALPDLDRLGEALKAGDDVTILTARKPAAMKPVLDLLTKRFGRRASRIKFKGVGSSSPKAKAQFITNVVIKHGYKSVFFMDDAMKNVDAVAALVGKTQADITVEHATRGTEIIAKKEKAKVNKAERETKKILREESQKQKAEAKKWEGIRKVNEEQFVDSLLKSNEKNVGRPSQALAREQGADVDSNKIIKRVFGKRWKNLNFFLPSGAEDFKGLLYTILGKSEAGDKQWKYFQNKLLTPFANAEAAIATKKVQALGDLKKALEGFKEVQNKLEKGERINLEDKIPGSKKVTYEQALRFVLHETTDADLRDKIKGDKKDFDLAIATIKGNPALMELAVSTTLAMGDKYPKFSVDRFWAGNLKTDMVEYVNRDFRREALAEWQGNADRMFSKDNLNKLEAAYGTTWRKAIEDSIKRMKSGKNRSHSNNATVNRFQDWINASVATTMMLNFRSGFLQLLSAFNFINAPGNNIFKAAATLANPKQFGKDFLHLFNSDFLKARRGGQSWDIAADEIAQLATGKNFFQAALSKMFQAGFTPTQVMDSVAIAAGGASWYRNALKDGMTEAEAMLAFQEISEEGQQSSRTDKISSLQASSLGRIVFAFANTPLQYARLTKRAFQDLANGRGDKAHNLSKLVWYGAAQGLIFNTIQSAVLAGLVDDDEDEWKNDRTDQNIRYGAVSFITSWLKGWGFPGAVAATLAGTLDEVEQQYISESKRKKGSKVAEKLLAISPPIAIKFRDISQAFNTWSYKQEREKMKYLPIWDKRNPKLRSIFQTLTAGTNVSAPEVTLAIIDRLRSWDNEQNGFLQNLAIQAGYNPEYSLGIEPSIADKVGLKIALAKGRIDFIKDGGLKGEIQDKIDAAKKKAKNPLNRGETGQAFKDGTIQVDPNLSPIEREKTIAHEEEHVRQMAEDGLDYDDNFISYKGGKFRRKNGSIRYNGKWMKEGDKKLPWEAHAYEAESPIARVDDKDKKKEDEKYIRNPKNIEQVNKSRERFAQHYSDPVTEELYRQNTGFNDLPSKVDTALNTRIQTGFVPQGAKATYDPAIGDYKGAITVEDYTDPAVVDHELSHAAGFDEALGKEAQKILGKPKSGDKYLSKPTELYGNLHEFRARLDLKGFERNLSPKKVQDLIKFNELEDDPDIKQMIDEFGLDKLSEALNKIASNKDKPTLEGLYS